MRMSSGMYNRRTSAPPRLCTCHMTYSCMHRHAALPLYVCSSHQQPTKHKSAARNCAQGTRVYHTSVTVPSIDIHNATAQSATCMSSRIHLHSRETFMLQDAAQHSLTHSSPTDLHLAGPQFGALLLPAVQHKGCQEPQRPEQGRHVHAEWQPYHVKHSCCLAIARACCIALRSQGRKIWEYTESVMPPPHGHRTTAKRKDKNLLLVVEDGTVGTIHSLPCRPIHSPCSRFNTSTGPNVACCCMCTSSGKQPYLLHGLPQTQPFMQQ